MTARTKPPRRVPIRRSVHKRASRDNWLVVSGSPLPDGRGSCHDMDTRRCCLSDANGPQVKIGIREELCSVSTIFVPL